MKKVEKILISLVIISFLLKYFQVAGYSILFILSIVFLSIIYIINGITFHNNVSFKELKTVKNPIHLIIGTISGQALSISLIGILFRIQFWPGDYVHVMLLVGTVILLFVLLSILIFFLQKKTKALLFSLIRNGSILLITGMLYFTKDWQLFSFFYPKNHALIESYKALENEPNNPILINRAHYQKVKNIIHPLEFKRYSKSLPFDSTGHPKK